ncbi:hypothetical protein EV702DRAFT_984005, partial [Suillus placidus]
SSNLRFGFSTSASHHSSSNGIAKYKERKFNQLLSLFGDAIDTESGAKSQGKTPWEGDVLLNFDAMENALDYAFVRLGIDAEGIEHPVLMTERLCSPLHSRAWNRMLIVLGRIPWTQQSTEYLLKLTQLKYSSFPTCVTSAQASVRPYAVLSSSSVINLPQWMLHNFCSFATDYPAVLRSLKIPCKHARS